jgi:hypothetical protein
MTPGDRAAARQVSEREETVNDEDRALIYDPSPNAFESVLRNLRANGTAVLDGRGRAVLTGLVSSPAGVLVTGGVFEDGDDNLPATAFALSPDMARRLAGELTLAAENIGRYNA